MITKRRINFSRYEKGLATTISASFGMLVGTMRDEQNKKSASDCMKEMSAKRLRHIAVNGFMAGVRIKGIHDGKIVTIKKITADGRLILVERDGVFHGRPKTYSPDVFEPLKD